MNSIENDDWSEEADEDDPLLSKESGEEERRKRSYGQHGNYGATSFESSSMYSSR